VKKKNTKILREANICKTQKRREN